MSDQEHPQDIAQLREQTMRFIEKEDRRQQERAAVACCDKCPQPKHEHDRKLTLPNGIRFSLYCCRCASPGPECTALVQSHLPSESPTIANRIVEWLAAQPELQALGVSWMTCGEARHILDYPTPAEAKVIAAVAAIPVEDFRGGVVSPGSH